MNGSQEPRPQRPRSSGGRWPLVWLLLILILIVLTIVAAFDRGKRYSASFGEVYQDMKRGFIDTGEPMKMGEKITGTYKSWSEIEQLIRTVEPPIDRAYERYQNAEEAYNGASTTLDQIAKARRPLEEKLAKASDERRQIEATLDEIGDAQPARAKQLRDTLARLESEIAADQLQQKELNAEIAQQAAVVAQRQAERDALAAEFKQIAGDWGKPIGSDERELLKTQKAGHTFVAVVDDRAEGMINKINETLRPNAVKSSNIWTQVLLSFLPILLIIGILYFLISRQMRSASGGAISFAKSRAKALTKDTNKVTFKDVAGVEEAKEELVEIIEFLKDPRRFTKLGGRIPKGVLLVGPPGTGKTLLAKSVAGEADVPFFTISGSDFVEMFVGVGAARVRDMFEQGKRNAPCIIFMDEIDAVGRHRGAGIGGGHDEREQTLNQLLVEMDGFDTKEGVILMAATNRPDVLDPALLRSGRFDRQIITDMPDLNGREGILKVHVRKVKLADEVELRRIARGTPGFSGADLANLINEAALLAARQNKNAVEMSDLEEARDKVAFGRERRSRTLSPEERKITAYHEAGHAVVLDRIEECEPLHKVTIVPRGVAMLGATMQLPKHDKYMQQKRELLGQITGLLAGRVSEELFFDDVTTGAANDFKNATRLAHAMVCDLGMSDTMGNLTYGAREDSVFLGKELGEIGRYREFSEQTAHEIDSEVRRIVDECRERARAILTEHKDKVEAVAEALLEYEVLEGKEVTQIIEGTWTPEAHAARRRAPAKATEGTEDSATPTADEKLAPNVIPRPNESSA